MTRSDRWFVVALLGGVLAVIITAVVALGWGRKDVSPPDLQDSPNPAIPGDILYVDRDSCIILARASGESRRQVACTGISPRLLFFLDASRIAYVDSVPSLETLVTIDLETGRELGRTPYKGDRPFLLQTAPDGTQAFQRDDGRIQLINVGQVVAELKFDGLDWGPQLAGWSPDSQWLAVIYYPPRGRAPELWLVSRDGSTRGTLARDSGGSAVAWRIPGVGAWPPPPD